MVLTRSEKKLAVSACIVACLIGAFAAYGAYTLGAERQFHGGILEGERSSAAWSLIWAAITAFAEFGTGAFLVAGVIPIAVWRFFRGDSGNA